MSSRLRQSPFSMPNHSKNPFVALDDPDHIIAVEAAANSAFFSTGQHYTASSRVIVTEGIHDSFVAAVGGRLKSVVVNDDMKAGTHIDPIVARRS